MKILGNPQISRNQMPKVVQRRFLGSEYSGGMMTVLYSEMADEDKGVVAGFVIEHGCSYGSQKVRIDLEIEEVNHLIAHLEAIRGAML